MHAPVEQAEQRHARNGDTSILPDGQGLVNPAGVKANRNAPDRENVRRSGDNVRSGTCAALWFLLLHHKCFDDVVDLEVVEVLQTHTTLVALQDFLGVFLEALQR